MDTRILPTPLAKSSHSLSFSLNNKRHRHFLLDPLHTLLSSDNHDVTICLHDIADAYHVLMRRITQHRRSLDTTSIQSPALKALMQEKANLPYIIRRDILRALEPPNLDSTSISYPLRSPTHSPFYIDEGLRKSHTDEVIACHGALKLVMEIFRSPVNNETLNGGLSCFLNIPLNLLSFIIDEELLGCLGDILRLLEAPDLPSFKGPMTHALCWAIMSTQNLPHHVLSTFQTRIIRILKSHLPKSPPEVSGDEEVVIDALQVRESFTLLVTSALTGTLYRQSPTLCDRTPRFSSLRPPNFFPDCFLTSPLLRTAYDITWPMSWPPSLISSCPRLRPQPRTPQFNALTRRAHRYQRSRSNSSIAKRLDPTHYSRTTSHISSALCLTPSPKIQALMEIVLVGSSPLSPAMSSCSATISFRTVEL